MHYPVLFLLLAALATLAPERPTDKDVKQLLERVNHDRDRFEDQLDGKLKRDVLRGTQGEVNVEQFLDDLQQNVGRLKDRFSSDYSASTECTMVLQQAGLIHRFMSAKPPNFKGASEWNRLTASLGELAIAYRTTFPLPDGATARRMNDREVQQTAEEVAEATELFRKEMDTSLRANNVDETMRRAALDEIDALEATARTLASRLENGQPASGEAQALLEEADALQRANAARSLSPMAKTAWASVRAALEKVAQGFGLMLPPVPTV
jgi:hypothetical protein